MLAWISDAVLVSTRLFHSRRDKAGRLDRLPNNRRNVGVTRRPRIYMAQATVPASCDEESVDEFGTLLAQPIFTRDQRQLPKALLQAINLDCNPLSFGTSLFFRA
jgi:hypothetical protein